MLTLKALLNLENNLCGDNPEDSAKIQLNTIIPLKETNQVFSGYQLC